MSSSVHEKKQLKIKAQFSTSYKKQKQKGGGGGRNGALRQVSPTVIAKYFEMGSSIRGGAEGCGGGGGLFQLHGAPFPHPPHTSKSKLVLGFSCPVECSFNSALQPRSEQFRMCNLINRKMDKIKYHSRIAQNI